MSTNKAARSALGLLTAAVAGRGGGRLLGGRRGLGGGRLGRRGGLGGCFGRRRSDWLLDRIFRDERRLAGERRFLPEGGALVGGAEFSGLVRLGQCLGRVRLRLVGRGTFIFGCNG